MDDNMRAKLSLAKIIARAWTDPVFKERFQRDPKSVLAEAGIKAREGTDIRVLEDTEALHHVVIPHRPAGVGKLSEQDLYSAAGSTLEASGLINKDSGTA